MNRKFKQNMANDKESRDQFESRDESESRLRCLRSVIFHHPQK